MGLSIEDIRYIIRQELSESVYPRLNSLEEAGYQTGDAVQAAIDSIIYPLQERIAALPPIPVIEIPPVAENSEEPITIVEVPPVISEIPEELVERITESIPNAIEEAITPVSEALEDVTNAIEQAQEIVTTEVPETIEEALETPIIEPAPDRGSAWTRPIFGGKD